MDIANSANNNLNTLSSLMFSQNIPSFLDPDLIQQALLRKCKSHSQETCDYIHISARAITPRICYSCIQENEIPIAEVLPLKQILQANSESILLTYPVFSNKEMNKKIKAIVGQVDIIVDQVDEFFQNLRQTVESAIDKLQRTQKLKLIKYTETYQKTIESFKNIAKIEELQKIIVSNASDNEDTLKEFIKTHCENQQANEDKINIHYQKFKEMNDNYSLKKAEEAISQIQDILKNINIFSNKEGNNLKENTQNDLVQFKKLAVSKLSQDINSSQDNAEGISLISTLSILPSKYLYSSEETTIILRNPNNLPNNNSILITNNNPDIQNIQCYINHELDPNKKYIIRVELNNMKDSPYFIFGLLEDKRKNSEFVALSNLSYCEATGYRMSRIIKGSQVHSGQRNIGFGQQREFRIHLAQQFFRIASYPDYSNVAELKDSKIIKENERYYFTIYIHGNTNSVLVKDVICVDNFDEKMN